MLAGLASRGKEAPANTPPPAPTQLAALPEDVTASTAQAQFHPSLGESKSKPAIPHSAETETQPAPAWQEELSGRVENFRRKRARMRRDFDPSTSLDLEFGRPDESNDEIMNKEVVNQAKQSLPSVSQLDAEIGTARYDSAAVESVALQKPVENLRILSSAAVEAGELDLEEEESPMEIVLEPPGVNKPAGSALAGPPAAAPLGKRFLAGVADTLALLMGSALFGLVFWAIGGTISMRPLTVGVLAFVAAFFIFVYFGMFIAFASSTPGLLAANLEVRSVDGNFPTEGEALWRAFGIVISAAALFLGFIWALVDSERLTWHDRISKTLIVVRK